MRIQSFHLSAQGASHIKKNKECQDASDSYFSEKCAIAVVCDGHGGDDYVRSAYGSSSACAAAKSNILNFIENVDQEELIRHHDQLLNKLCASIIGAWNVAINDHYETHPFTEKEIAVLSPRAQKKYLQEHRIESAYGTTVIAVAVTEKYWFGLHIGDGKCVAIDSSSTFSQPIPWDERCFLNATTSICDSDALSRFRFCFSEQPPVAVFVGSDGIDDCFNSEQQLYNLYKTVLYSFATTDFDAAIKDLQDYLPRLSAKGSGDDVSIAAILDLDQIGEIDVIKEYDREKEKARVEENAKLAAAKAEEERRRVEQERAKQREAQEKKTAPKYCTNCGAKIYPSMKFCGECGRPILPRKPVPAPADEEPVSPIAKGTVEIVKVVPFGNDGQSTDTPQETRDYREDEIATEDTPGKDHSQSSDDEAVTSTGTSNSDAEGASTETIEAPDTGGPISSDNGLAEAGEESGAPDPSPVRGPSFSEGDGQEEAASGDVAPDPIPAEEEKSEAGLPAECKEILEDIEKNFQEAMGATQTSE